MATVQDQIRQAATAQGVDPAIALAVAQQESSFNQSARGTSGEVGIFQLMPATAAGLDVNPYDTSQNIQGGISYLAQLYKQFGDWAKALVAYNAGPTAAASGTAPSASLAYAQSVLGKSAAYGATEAVSTTDSISTTDSGVSTDFGTAYTEAGVLGDLGQIPWWVWLALAGGVGFLVMARSD